MNGGKVFVLGKRAGNARAPALQAALLPEIAHGFRRAAHDNVGHRQAPAGPQHAEDLRKHGRLVRSEVDDAVADGSVGGAGSER